MLDCGEEADGGREKANRVAESVKIRHSTSGMETNSEDSGERSSVRAQIVSDVFPLIR